MIIRNDRRVLDTVCLDCEDVLLTVCVKCSDCPVGKLKSKLKEEHK